MSRRLHMLSLWPVLIMDVLLWVLVMPPIVVVAWCAMRLGVCVCDLVFVMKPVPVFLDTPWELLQSWYLIFHGVKVVDADGANTWRLPDVRNIEGCLLTNHRSWGDFVIDPAMAFAPVVARTAAVAATMLAGVVGLTCGKVVMINRGKTSRQQLKERCATLKRYMFYPEGTRRAGHADADEPGALKVGGLKNIFESGHATHIIISVNKVSLALTLTPFLTLTLTLALAPTLALTLTRSASGTRRRGGSAAARRSTARATPGPSRPPTTPPSRASSPR